MSDPLSTTASIIAVLQLSSKAIQYVKDVKGGASDRTRLRDELRNTTCVLEMLRDRIEDFDDSGSLGLKPAVVSTLLASDGPLQLLKRTLQNIIAKLIPQDRLRKLAQPFTWPFDKKDIQELLTTLERLKSNFSLIMENELVELAKESNIKLDGISNQIGNLVEARRDHQAERILRWISSLSFRSKQANVLQSVQPGTGQWFLHHRIYLDWADGNIKTLWCPGIPGAGKTRIASLVIDHLERRQTDPKDALVYIYCDYRETEAQTPLTLLSSILEQIIRHASDSAMPLEVLSLYERHRRAGTRPTLVQITDVLHKICLPPRTIEIVIDALDECAESEEATLNIVSNILAIGPSVRLLCTSRFSTTFDTFFRNDGRIEISAHNDDIRNFLEARIPGRAPLSRHVRADPGLQDDIVKTIIEESQGMFLLAVLHFESLSRKISRKEVRASLHALPGTLDATYEQALLRIRNQADEYVELAETVLFWILCARLPLKVLEIQQMYAMQSISCGEMLEDDDLPDSETLTAVCTGLIKVDRDTKSIRIVHYTAQQYFERTHPEQLSRARFNLTKCCLRYLTLPNFADGFCLSHETMTARLKQFPFLIYAACHWGSEGHNVDWDTLWAYLRDFVSNKTAINIATQIWTISDRVGDVSNLAWEIFQDPFIMLGSAIDVPPLVLAASFDIPKVLRRMVEDNHDINITGFRRETALIRAASLGLMANVATLLELGASVHYIDRYGDTALARAAANGHEAIVRALLDAGANTKFRGFPILRSAVLSGNLDVVRMIIEASTGTIQPTWVESALDIAIGEGHENIANYLVTIRLVAIE